MSLTSREATQDQGHPYTPIVLDRLYRIISNYLAGNDPHILDLLQKFYEDSFFEDGPDFGKPLPLPATRQPLRLNNNRPHALQNWHPEGTLIAHLTEHQGPVNRVVVAPDHNFFATCSDDGTVKIWDTIRLEKNVVNRARLTYRHEGTEVKVKNICFIDNTHCIASAGNDGSIHLFKVDYSEGTLTPKYGKIKVIKKHALEQGEYAVWMESYRQGFSCSVQKHPNYEQIIDCY